MGLSQTFGDESNNCSYIHKPYVTADIDYIQYYVRSPPEASCIPSTLRNSRIARPPAPTRTSECTLQVMSPPALVIAGLVIVPISIAVSVTVYGYRRFRARRAQQRAQHHRWHRNSVQDIELLPIKPRADAHPAVKHASWPRSLHDNGGIPNTRFTPMRTFPVPYWGPSDEWGPKDVPVATPYSASTRGMECS